MTTKQKKSNAVNAILWAVQGILIFTFIRAGCMKIFQPQELPFPWVKGHRIMVMITGAVDLPAGIGLFLTIVFQRLKLLAVYLSYGIIILMVCAIIFHISKGKDIGFNIAVILMAFFLVWSRTKRF